MLSYAKRHNFSCRLYFFLNRKFPISRWNAIAIIMPTVIEMHCVKDYRRPKPEIVNEIVCTVCDKYTNRHYSFCLIVILRLAIWKLFFNTWAKTWRRVCGTDTNFRGTKFWNDLFLGNNFHFNAENFWWLILVINIFFVCRLVVSSLTSLSLRLIFQKRLIRYATMSSRRN